MLVLYVQVKKGMLCQAMVSAESTLQLNKLPYLQAHEFAVCLFVSNEHHYSTRMRPLTLCMPTFSQ